MKFSLLFILEMLGKIGCVIFYVIHCESLLTLGLSNSELIWQIIVASTILIIITISGTKKDHTKDNDEKD